METAEEDEEEADGPRERGARLFGKKLEKT